MEDDKAILKVAIIQNRLQAGGRMQVTLHMIKVLNDLGIEPTLLTFRSKKTADEYQDLYGFKGLRFTIKTLGINPKVPFEWNFMLFNKLVNRRAKKFNLVINNNNTSIFLSKKINLLSYYHFPRKARATAKKNSIHFPEGSNKSFLDYKLDLFFIAKSFYRRRKKLLPLETILANSNFTKDHILKNYKTDESEIEVLYPPVKISDYTSNNREPNSIVSLGRFASDKQQLEQIKIASRLPQFKFTLVGFVNDAHYFEKCKNYLTQENIGNVELKPNVSDDEREKILMKSEYFFHSLINEPFGITVVQAIDGGCIPLVHNSGGPMEIVPIEELRYNGFDDLERKLKLLAKWDDEQKEIVRKELYANIQKFSDINFEDRWKAILLKKIKNNGY